MADLGFIAWGGRVVGEGGQIISRGADNSKGVPNLLI